MGFNRIEAKINARTSMRQTKPSALLVTLVFLLLTVGVSGIVMSVAGDPWSEMLNYLMMGYEVDEVINYVLFRSPGRIGIYALLSLLIGIYEIVMEFGYTSYSLRLSRNEQPGYQRLFDGFAKLGRILWAGILVEIFAGLWGMLLMLPSILVSVAAILVGETMFGMALVLAAGVLSIVGGILMVGVIYRYRLTSYFLLDHPEYTARQAIRSSKAAMKGWKMELFMLDLSFIGWLLLAMMTFGVLSVWVLPYWRTAEANFYNHVTAASRTSGGYAGKGYDYRVGEDPTPFQ